MSCLDDKLPVDLRERYSLHFGATNARLDRVEAWVRGGPTLGSWSIESGSKTSAALIHQAIEKAIAAIRRDAYTEKGVS